MICRKCKQEKDIGDFFAAYIANHNYICKTCNREMDKIRNRKRAPQAAAMQRSKHLNDPRERMLVSAKRRASKKGLEFSLTIQDIVIPERCTILNLPLQVSIGKPKANSPSLDRIVNTCGYVAGNVQVISYRANSLKADASIGDIERLLDYMRLGLQD